VLIAIYNSGPVPDKALAWFGRFGGTEPGDDSANVMDFKKKPYRDLIMANDISMFDFRNYLFARQCQLLGRQHKFDEICIRAQIFITSFARTIKENESSLGGYFLESWVYLACMNVVDECEEVSHGHSSAAFNAVKGELLDLARKQVGY
jgi:hypothetical protein